MGEWEVLDTPAVNVTHRLGSDVDFDLVWWADLAKTVKGGPVQTVSGTIEEIRSGDEVLDLGAHCTVPAAPNDHIVSVSVDRVTADALDRGIYRWRIVAHTALGEDKTLGHGAWRAVR